MTFAAHAIAATHLAPLKYGKKKTYLLWAMWAAVFIAGSSTMSPPQSWSTAFSAAAFSTACLCHVGLYFLTTTGRAGERFFLILSYAAFFTACCAITQFFKAFLLPQSDWLHLVVFALTLAATLWVFWGKLLPIFRQSARYIGKAWRILSALMALFMLSLMTWFVFPSYMQDFTAKQAAGLPVLVIVMFVTYGVIFVCIRNIAAAQRAKQIELRLELLTAQVDAQSQAAEEARRARHDLRHHNLTLLALAEQGNAEEIVRYLRGMTDQESAAETIWCKNDTLSSLLSGYATKAAVANIKTDILAQAERDISVSPADLVTVVANLFENAIHGAASSGASRPYITIRIHRKVDKLVVRMENACKPGFDYPGGFPAERWDVGLFSVQSIVEAYDGELSLTAENGIFTALVLLNLPA